jgi:transcriptional regulator GlxA family with amidase domain
VLVDQLTTATEVTNHLPASTQPLLIPIAEMFAADPAENRTLHDLGHQLGASTRTLSWLFRTDRQTSLHQTRRRSEQRD